MLIHQFFFFKVFLYPPSVRTHTLIRGHRNMAGSPRAMECSHWGTVPPTQGFQKEQGFPFCSWETQWDDPAFLCTLGQIGLPGEWQRGGLCLAQTLSVSQGSLGRGVLSPACCPALQGCQPLDLAPPWGGGAWLRGQSAVVLWEHNYVPEMGMCSKASDFLSLILNPKWCFINNCIF